MKSFRQFVADNDNQFKHTIKGKSGIPDTGRQNPKWNRSEAPQSGIHASIASWHDRHVRYSDGGSVTTTGAYESYLNHCERKGLDSLPLPSFNRQWQDYSGHIAQRIAGRTRHIGINLREGRKTG